MTGLDNIAHEISLVGEVLHIKIVDNQECETYICDIADDDISHNKLIRTTSMLCEMLNDVFGKRNDAVSITYC